MRSVPAVLVPLLLLSSPAAPPTMGQEATELRESRLRMVREQVASGGPGRTAVEDEEVLAALRSVPRHEFVSEGLRSAAYADRPLPIGHGQTISQPYVVARMTALLRPEAGDRMLEVGTGSGYQAAVLAEIVESVHTIEIIEPLAESASARLERLGYADVRVRHGDGYFGWPEAAPFDGIVVTAAASHIPPPLMDQLAPGGRMVIPVGPPLQVQSLMLVEKRADGSVVQRHVMPVRFVPFTRSP